MSYKLGRVYRIICLPQPDIQYIGSTFDELRHRWRGHKKSYKSRNRDISIYKFFDEYCIENFKIVLIKEYEVVDRNHLRAYEQLWINKTKCVNKYNPFSITYLQVKKYLEDTNFHKNWYKNNKVKSSEKCKEYKKKNKDKLSVYNREYYKKNREKILKNKKLKR